MLDVATYIVVILWGVFLVGLGVTSFIKPDATKAFLLAFAQTRAKHFIEMALRLIVGASMLVQSSRIEFPVVFAIFGWMLVGTTAVLILVPWRWHKAFADKTVPNAVRYISLMGIFALALGVFMISLMILRP